MNKANINDRQSVAALYPRSAFDEDAARNALGTTEIVYGVRIESSPDETGWFVFARARHHVGELTGFAEAVFIAANRPHLTAPLLGSDPDDGAPQGPTVTAEARAQEYEAFVDRVLEAARTAEFQNPIGRGEERLEGFHGG
jgi:hypothetical protein